MNGKYIFMLIGVFFFLYKILIQSFGFIVLMEIMIYDKKKLKRWKFKKFDDCYDINVF